jgi:hypothetical protein
VLKGFRFPSKDELPLDIRQLAVFSGVTYSHEHFQETIERLVEIIDDGERRLLAQERVRLSV